MIDISHGYLVNRSNATKFSIPVFSVIKKGDFCLAKPKPKFVMNFWQKFIHNFSKFLLKASFGNFCFRRRRTGAQKKSVENESLRFLPKSVEFSEIDKMSNQDIEARK